MRAHILGFRRALAIQIQEKTVEFRLYFHMGSRANGRLLIDKRMAERIQDIVAQHTV